VNYLDQYILQFSGLGDGLHQFEYSVNGTFFHEFAYEEISDCDVHVRVDMSKQPEMLELKFTFSGYVVCACDRCMENYKQEVSGHERLVVKFGEQTDETSDDMIILPHHENEINLGQYIYESIVLLLPQRRVHPEDENGKSDCNPEIIKRLDDLSQQKNTDPRWDDLKKLTLKN